MISTLPLQKSSKRVFRARSCAPGPSTSIYSTSRTTNTFLVSVNPSKIKFNPARIPTPKGILWASFQIRRKSIWSLIKTKKIRPNLIWPRTTTTAPRRSLTTSTTTSFLKKSMKSKAARSSFLLRYSNSSSSSRRAQISPNRLQVHLGNGTNLFICASKIWSCRRGIQIWMRQFTAPECNTGIKAQRRWIVRPRKLSLTTITVWPIIRSTLWSHSIWAAHLPFTSKCETTSPWRQRFCPLKLPAPFRFGIACRRGLCLTSPSTLPTNSKET